MNEEKMREEFEAAIAEEAGQPLIAIQLSRKDNSYSTSSLIYAWWAWQASRAAVVVELPEPEEFDGYYNGGYAIRRENVVKAIEAAGLKVSK